MKKFIAIFVSLVFVLGATDALAKKKKKKKKRRKKAKSAMVYKAAYGSAGCGLGSLVIKGDGFSQVFAATLNATGYQPSAMTTGTSNCTPGAKIAMEQEVFIESNLANLKVDAAKGDGNSLVAFAELLGCDYSSFAKRSQENYSVLYTGSAAEIRDSHRKVFAGKCSRAG